MTAVWPLPDLLDHLRGLHDIGANEAADRLAGWGADREDVAKHLRYLANELRQAGDVQLVVMDDEGVAPSALTFADSLELVAINLVGILGTSEREQWKAKAMAAAAQLAAVVAALDTYAKNKTAVTQGLCVSAIAKAVGR